MTFDAEDRIAHRLRQLTVLDSNPERRNRTRARCRAALTEHQPVSHHSIATPWVRAFGVESGLAYGLSAAYVVGIIADLLRIYLRR
jgi:hypothetical protein